MSEVRSENPVTTTVVGTGDAVGLPKISQGRVGSCKRKWLIARVQPNTEKSSCLKLQNLNYEGFAVTQEETVFWKNGERRKKKKIQRVIITQFIFVHVTEKEREKLLTHHFIKGFLINRATSGELRTFAELSDQEIERLKHLTSQSEYPVKFTPSQFEMGEEVTLQLGNSIYTANVFRILGENSTCIGVRVKALGCAYIEVPKAILTKQS